jgi:HAMP domain-containing protein
VPENRLPRSLSRVRFIRQEPQVDKFSSKLRIGEKLGIGFTLVGLLFVGVIWHDYRTLQSVLGNYEQLQTVFENRKSLALEIEIEMAAARDAEKSFLIQRQERFAGEVARRLENVRQKVAALATIDEPSRQTAEALQGPLKTYAESFDAVVDASRSMGLDENSGLQGSFRQRVHRLHALSASYNVDRLQTGLLQIRRHEKDFALRRDPVSRERVQQLTAEFRRLIVDSELQDGVKQRLLGELAVYTRAFAPYAETTLGGGNIGAAAPLREAANRMEAILDAYHVPDLETEVLKLRRREKDFLLRGDPVYAPMVADIARNIRSRIAESRIADADKALLAGLLRDYQRSFLVLVSRHANIGILTREMDTAAGQVAPLIKANADQANQAMRTRVEEIAESSAASVRLGLIVMGCALALGILFAVALTLRIVRPVRQMAGLLDDLAYGTPTGRVPTVPGGRNEINAMGESLNALLDHRATFLGWWKASMNELIARRDLQDAASQASQDEALSELHAASIARVQQLNAISGRLMQHARCMVDVSRRIHAAGRVKAEDDKALEHAAQGMTSLLEVIAAEAPAAARPENRPQTLARSATA